MFAVGVDSTFIIVNVFRSAGKIVSLTVVEEPFKYIYEKFELILDSDLT